MQESIINGLTQVVAQLTALRQMADMRTGIYEALPLIMDEVGHIAKDRPNVQQGYKFRGIDDVYKAIQKILAKHKVTPIPFVLAESREDRTTKSGTVMVYTVLWMQYTLYHADGSSIVASTVGEASDSGDKSSNKAMSAAQKYALIQIFCVPTEEDLDTENQSPEWAPQQPKQAAKQVQKQEQPKQQNNAPKVCTQCNKEARAWMGNTGVCKPCHDASKAAEAPKEEAPKQAAQPAAVAEKEGTAQSSASEQAGSTNGTVTKEMVKQMMIEAGANGWTAQDVSAFILANEAIFKVKPAQIATVSLDVFAQLHDWVCTNKPGAKSA